MKHSADFRVFMAMVRWYRYADALHRTAVGYIKCFAVALATYTVCIYMCVDGDDDDQSLGCCCARICLFRAYVTSVSV